MLKAERKSEAPLPLDDVDRKILALLQENARISFRDIADAVGVSVGTVHNRIKKLENLNIIKGYTTLLDPYKLGFELTALILMQVDGAHIIEVEREIAKHREVCGVYDITGDFDILVIARFRTREELNNFIKSILKLPHIKRTVTSIALNIVKENFKLRI